KEKNVNLSSCVKSTHQNYGNYGEIMALQQLLLRKHYESRAKIRNITEIEEQLRQTTIVNSTEQPQKLDIISCLTLNCLTKNSGISNDDMFIEGALYFLCFWASCLCKPLMSLYS